MRSGSTWPWDTSQDVVSLHIELSLSQSRPVNSLQEDILAALRSSLPPLQSIRPEKLRFELLSTEPLLSLLIQVLTEERVAQSVSSIYVAQLYPRVPLVEPVSDLEHACAILDRSSQSGIRRLTMRDVSNDTLRSLPLYLPGLISLDFDFPLDEITQLQAVRELGSLSGHPTLRELKIRHRIDSSLAPTLASCSNIEHLDAQFDCHMVPRNVDDDWFGHAEDDRVRVGAFGNMIRGMTSLQSLQNLEGPTVEFWEYLRDSNITSNHLQELGIKTMSFDAGTADRLETTVRNLQRFAPSLNRLYLFDNLIDHCNYTGEEDAIRALSALRHHPTLRELHLSLHGWQESDISREKALILRIQQELGSTFKVVSE